MIFETIKAKDKNGKEIELRSADERDAEDLLKWLKTVNTESPYLTCEPEEIKMTLEQEREFIKGITEAPKDLLLLAFEDGKHIGNCRMSSIGSTIRYRHRCSVGIALYQAYSGRGIGRLMLETVLSVAKDTGYEQAELEVAVPNEKAIALYKSLGFEIFGTVPHGVKYKDGSYADYYSMVKTLVD